MFADPGCVDDRRRAAVLDCQFRARRREAYDRSRIGLRVGRADD
jgi:hypothetical protein